MNPWSIKLLQNTVKNITKKVLLPAFVFLSLPASLVEAQARPAYGESTSHGAIAPSSASQTGDALRHVLRALLVQRLHKEAIASV